MKFLNIFKQAITNKKKSTRYQSVENCLLLYHVWHVLAVKIKRFINKAQRSIEILGFLRDHYILHRKPLNST